MEIVINYWAVLGAVIVAVALGMVWYGPLFGRQWMRTVGISHEEMERAKEKGMQGMWRTYALMILGTLVMAYVLAHVLAYAMAFTGEEGTEAGISGAISIWIGFVAPVIMGNVLWDGRPWKYWFIVSGYYLVSLILMGVILANA